MNCQGTCCFSCATHHISSWGSCEHSSSVAEMPLVFHVAQTIACRTWPVSCDSTAQKVLDEISRLLPDWQGACHRTNRTRTARPGVLPHGALAAALADGSDSALAGSLGARFRTLARSYTCVPRTTSRCTCGALASNRWPGSGTARNSAGPHGTSTGWTSCGISAPRSDSLFLARTMRIFAPRTHRIFPPR